MENMPHNIDRMVLSNDQQYLYDICLPISRGECYSDLTLRKPGPVVHSRWLRILRLYVVTEKPSDNLIIFATYIMKGCEFDERIVQELTQKEDPVLLIADNHTSHFSLPAVSFRRENHVTFLNLPPHASHVLQPLDKCFFAHLKALYPSETEKWIVQNPGKAITLYKVSGIFQKAYSATARVQLAEKAFRVTGIEPNNPGIISEDCYSPSLVTLEPLDNDFSVAPEENEVSSSTSQIDVSIQSILPLPRLEQRGAKRERKSQKSEILISSPFRNFLEKKDKVELEEAKANRVFKKNINGDKTKKKKIPESKEKTYSEFYRKPSSFNKFGK
ncbi:hypothetical protein AVEN_57427-1 [Araneus ventricosus]|uniref:DDE-1 domain-containing protein n=1 Tax=Araneus ventricosus TaxID=182803 RepID=A0A4Y2D009_ARAVE|nr:hypothetical protein AVEN_57427-1 [Araneus ventricosus]